MVRHASRRPARGSTAEDLKELVATAERTLARLPQSANAELRHLRERLGDAVTASRESLVHLREQAKEQLDRADDVVRSHPYQTIGIAAGVGALVGFFIARRTYR